MKISLPIFATFAAIPFAIVAAQNGPGSVACDTCLAACKANPSGISQACVDACNKNLECNATITTSTIGGPSPTATGSPVPTNGALGSAYVAAPLSMLGVVGMAMALL